MKGALVVLLLALSTLVGCAASGSSSEDSAAPERNPAEEKAWDELSSILSDLGLLNARVDHAVELARDLGATMSVSSMVPYNEYEKLSERLHVWRDASSIEHPAYWDELASAALNMSDSLVKYAYGGDEIDLADADDARQRLNATLDAHCEKPDYSLLVEYCN